MIETDRDDPDIEFVVAADGPLRLG